MNGHSFQLPKYFTQTSNMNGVVAFQEKNESMAYITVYRSFTLQKETFIDHLRKNLVIPKKKKVLFM